MENRRATHSTLLPARRIFFLAVLPMVVSALSFSNASALRDAIVLSGHGEYGFLWGSNNFARDYNQGPGMSIGIEFTLGRRSAVGATFESLHFNPPTSSTQTGPGAPDRLEVSTALLTGRRRLAESVSGTTYVLAGFGIGHPTEYRIGGDVKIFFDRLIVFAGAGREMFITQTFALDVRVKMYSMRSSEGNNQSMQLTLGLAKYVPR